MVFHKLSLLCLKICGCYFADIVISRKGNNEHVSTDAAAIALLMMVLLMLRVFSIKSCYGFPFALIVSLVGSELDFSHTFTVLSVGNRSIFTRFATFNSIRFGFPCPLFALLIGRRCCFVHDNAVANEQG